MQFFIFSIHHLLQSHDHIKFCERVSVDTCTNIQ